MPPQTTTTDDAPPSVHNGRNQVMRLEDIYARRKKTDKSQWGTAAPSRSEDFKVYSHAHKPLAQRWAARLTPESLARTPSRIKGVSPYLSKPDLISLGGGLPTPDYFPFDNLTFTAPSPSHLGTTTTTTSSSSSASTTPRLRITAGKHDMPAGLSNYDIATAFNYHQGRGSAQLLRWLTEHTESVHDPPYRDWAVTMSVGNTSALELTLRMLAEPGDAIVTDEYAFSSAVDAAAPMGVVFVGVEMDGEGMVPEALDAVLSGWDAANRGGVRKPRVLYAVPTGHNPTGATQSAARRRQVYDVARKHDLLIIEDDPYYFLQMEPYAPGGSDDDAKGGPRLSREEFMKTLVPSLLSMDVDGRVMRLDSFSKVVAPGSRVGWVVASEELIEQYAKHAEVSTQGPSGISQLMLFKLLDETWGHEGYVDWLIHIRGEYTKRRNVIVGACEKYLPSVVSWNPPMAGMFHWMEVDWRKHPHASSKSITELEEELFLRSVEKGSLVIRGSWFRPEEGLDPGNERMFFRASFAAAPSGSIEEAICRFGLAVKESFQL